MNNNNDINGGMRGVPAAKSRKEILQELLELEEQNIGNLGKQQLEQVDSNETINAHDEGGMGEDIPSAITKPKKKLTEKQLEALKKGQQKRDENARKRKEEQKKKEEQEKKIAEEKIIKKAISIKKKQIKKQAVLDEISDDDTPIQKIKEVALREPTVPPNPLPSKSIPKINFF